MAPESSFSGSLWSTTAAPPPETPALRGEASTEVCVIGGGFTGLSTALALSERGISSVLIEAEEPGWGASGRNGGQVIPGLKMDPDTVVRDFGGDQGERMVETAGHAADVVFDLIERHGIECGARRCGWISAAHSEASLAGRRDLAEQWRARGAPVEILDHEGIARLLGAKGYVGGLLDRRGGKINPLSYARGLTRAAQSGRCTVHGKTPARRISREAGRWRVETPSGHVKAETVVIATNGYTDDLWPGLRQTIVPVFSAQAATRPLSDNLMRSILPEGHVVSDVRRLIRYFRLDDDGRLVMGGRGKFADTSDPTKFRHIEGDAQAMFPQLGPLQWEYRWAGRIAMTTDHYPHVYEPAPGVLCALGYNGRGVAMASAMGRVLAERIAGASDKDLAFPVTTMRRIPFHSLRRPGIELLILSKRLADRFGD